MSNPKHNLASFEESLIRRPSQCPPKPRPKLKGPLRVLRLCILSIFLPGFLIAGPLYLRYHVYGDQLYPLAMSDMRVLDNKVSTTWCQRQLVKVNTTFNAFLLPETPRLAEKLKPLSMVRHLILEDDMKEYWGFYLLRGSSVTVSTCVRWPGASLIVIRGHKHLHECAYIGDDSSEEIEEQMRNIEEQNMVVENPSEEDAPANKPGMMQRHRPLVQFHHPNYTKHESHTLEHEQEIEDHVTDPKIMKSLLGQLMMKSVKDRVFKENAVGETKDHVHKHRDQTINQEEKKYLTFEEPKPAEDSEELFQNVLRKLQKLGDRGHGVLQKLNEQLLGNEDEDMKKIMDNVMKEPDEKSVEKPVINTMGRHWSKTRVRYEDNIEETNRKKREIHISPPMETALNEDDELLDAAIEEGFTPDGIADHRGIFNETDLNDRSRSEFWSSFSSSEEALLNCAGLILNLPLTPSRYCQRHRGLESLEEASLANTVTYRVPSNGYYFFVFNSENEVQANYIRVQFHLNKAVYNLSNPVSQCSNSTGKCALDLGFYSSEKLVLELPVKDNDTLWNQEFVVLSECEPRTSLYIICVISVPLAIILFAFQ